MSRTVPVGQREAAEREDRAEREVGDRPGGADRDPPAARLEPRLARVHVGVREDHDQLQPRLLDAPPERRHRQPVRRLVHGDDGEAAEQEHEPAEPDLVRDDERRAVAQRDQRGEHADADHAERARSPTARAA